MKKEKVTNSKSRAANTKLLQLVENDSLSSAELEELIAIGADVNVLLNDSTPLMVASAEGYYDIVKLLLANKADSYIKNEHDETSLYLACNNGHYDIAQLLLVNGADADMAGIGGNAPLKAAYTLGYYDIAKLLLANKAKIDGGVHEYGGTPPLHEACTNDDFKAVKFLLEFGADVSREDKYGHTPFRIAFDRGYYDIARWLLVGGFWQKVLI